jgi:hypothetical protein
LRRIRLDRATDEVGGLVGQSQGPYRAGVPRANPGAVLISLKSVELFFERGAEDGERRSTLK